MNDFLEKDLEEIIFTNRSIIKDRGFIDLSDGALISQFCLPCRKIIDLFHFSVQDDVLTATIIELKKGEITIEALLQAIEYNSEVIGYSCRSFKDTEVSIILCGKSISQNVKEIAALTENVSLYVYDYTFHGIEFKPVGATIKKLVHKLRSFDAPPNEDEMGFKRNLVSKYSAEGVRATSSSGTGTH